MNKSDPKAKTSELTFVELKIGIKYGSVINRIFYVLENDRSIVMENFRDIDSDIRDHVKDLICKMATNRDFKSPLIKYHLKGYNYGEIRPMPHRFFFFQKFGANIIFFSYVLKKKNSFNDSFYKELNEAKERYEREFEKFIERYR